jgi:2-keto-4-pentenoate hydratase/2-oxohepta-3-ene-1,7-dioic acid hydratase in catechol pathway
MKLIRFEDSDGKIRIGEPLGENRARLVEGDLFGDLATSDAVAEVKRLLVPVDPPDVIAIGMNYRRHAAEMNLALPERPAIFSKLTSCVIAPHDPIILPPDAPDEVDFEAELAVVIAKPTHRVRASEALDYVLGYTCANDVTARDCQRYRDVQWTRAKSFDSFGPLGPWLLIDRELDPNRLALRSLVNDEVMQNSNTADMVFSVEQIVSYLSHQFTLRPGTVILTGTPEGIGAGRDPAVFLKPGDVVTIDIEGIGTLTNPVQTAN